MGSNFFKDFFRMLQKFYPGAMSFAPPKNMIEYPELDL